MVRRRGGAVVGLLLGLLLLGLTLGAGGPAASAQTSSPAPSTVAPTAAEAVPGGPRAARTLVISIPTVTWLEIAELRVPNLRRLAASSAIAGLTTRPVREVDARAGDAYLTIGAGSRAETPAPAAGLAFGADERAGEATGAERYAAATGDVLTESVGQVAWPEIVTHNDALLYAAELGALGVALREHGVGAAVVGNADRPGTRDVGAEVAVAPEHREIALALMDDRGQVDGRVDAGLLEVDDDAPYGVRLDPSEVLDAFDASWRDGQVVAVEMSDLARVQAMETTVGEVRNEHWRRTAIERADALVGELLARTDPSRDAVLVIAPYHSSPGVDLTIAMLRAPGVEPGLLTSAATGRNGYVTITDVGPTVAELMGVPVPAAMEGTRWERSTRGGTDVDARIDRLVDANRSAKMRDDTITSATVVLIASAVIVLVAGFFALTRPVTRGRRGLPTLALLVPGFLLGTHVVLVFPITDWWWGWYWVIVVGFAVAFAGGVELSSRGDALRRTLLAFGTLTGFHVVNQVIGAPFELDSVFGYTATVGIRISGLGNQSFAELSIAALVTAAVLLVRPGGRTGGVATVVTLGATLAVIGAPWWGADFGGLLAATPAFLVFGHLASGRRLRVRTVVGVLAAALVAGLVAGFVDLLRPAGQRTHIGRFFERVGRDGFDGFWTVISRKANLVFEVFGDPRIILLVVFLVVLVAVAARWWWRNAAAAVEAELPTLRPMLVGCAVVGGLGFALNDSGIVVPGTMLAVLVPALLALTPTTPGDRVVLTEESTKLTGGATT